MTTLHAARSQKEIFRSRLGPEYVGFDHITWYVGNAKQAATYYVSRFGFKEIAYKGLETGSKAITARVVTNGAATFVFISPVRGLSELDGGRETALDACEAMLLHSLHEYLAKHGDGVKDIAFRIRADVTTIWNKAVARGAGRVRTPKRIRTEDGEVETATIGAYGDITHTFVYRDKYRGVFMPGYAPLKHEDPINDCLPRIDLVEIDHCVGNQPWDGVDKVVKFYENCLGFHRHWTVDDASACSDYSAMRSIVVASGNKVIKMPINEPARGKAKSQVEEFVDFHHGPGVQHIAFLTRDIVTAVTHLRLRGVEFLHVPKTYYTDLRIRLKESGMQLYESVDDLERLNILVDFDEDGYLLQIFAKHVVDRPTMFVEVIQRNGFGGFGAGNFRALFQAYEREQALRNNL